MRNSMNTYVRIWHIKLSIIKIISTLTICTFIVRKDAFLVVVGCSHRKNASFPQSFQISLEFWCIFSGLRPRFCFRYECKVWILVGDNLNWLNFNQMSISKWCLHILMSSFGRIFVTIHFYSSSRFCSILAFRITSKI